jgi:hypothetical protein
MKDTYIYLVSDGEFIKVGISTNVGRRIKQLQTGNGKRLYLLGYYKGSIAEESFIHHHFKRLNLEWMYATEELIEYANSHFTDCEIMIIDGKLRSLFKMKL